MITDSMGFFEAFLRLPKRKSIDHDLKFQVNKIIKTLPCILKLHAAVRHQNLTLYLTWITS